RARRPARAGVARRRSCPPPLGPASRSAPALTPRRRADAARSRPSRAVRSPCARVTTTRRPHRRRRHPADGWVRRPRHARPTTGSLHLSSPSPAQKGLRHLMGTWVKRSLNVGALTAGAILAGAVAAQADAAAVDVSEAQK